MSDVNENNEIIQTKIERNIEQFPNLRFPHRLSNGPRRITSCCRCGGDIRNRSATWSRRYRKLEGVSVYHGLSWSRIWNHMYHISPYFEDYLYHKFLISQVIKMQEPLSASKKVALPLFAADKSPRYSRCANSVDVIQGCGLTVLTTSKGYISCE